MLSSPVECSGFDHTLLLSAGQGHRIRRHACRPAQRKSWRLGFHFQIERKRQSTLDLGHHLIGKLTESALKSHPWQRAEALDIGHGVTVKKGEFWQPTS